MRWPASHLTLFLWTCYANLLKVKTSSLSRLSLLIGALHILSISLTPFLPESPSDHLEARARPFDKHPFKGLLFLCVRGACFGADSLPLSLDERRSNFIHEARRVIISRGLRERFLWNISRFRRKHRSHDRNDAGKSPLPPILFPARLGHQQPW